MPNPFLTKKLENQAPLKAAPNEEIQQDLSIIQDRELQMAGFEEALRQNQELQDSKYKLLGVTYKDGPEMIRLKNAEKQLLSFFPSGSCLRIRTPLKNSFQRQKICAESSLKAAGLTRSAISVPGLLPAKPANRCSCKSGKLRNLKTRNCRPPQRFSRNGIWRTPAGLMYWVP